MRLFNSYTNPFIFKQGSDGEFIKDDNGNLIRNFEIEINDYESCNY